MKLTVFMGIPGAGKGHYIKTNYMGDAIIASADDWFTHAGKYVFEPTRLSQAHGACFRKVIDALRDDVEHVVVDNTNTSLIEIAPYMAAAQAYGAVASIVCLRIDAAVAGPRNVHKVPQATVIRMEQAIEASLETMPPWWRRAILSWDIVTESYKQG